MTLPATCQDAMNAQLDDQGLVCVLQALMKVVHWSGDIRHSDRNLLLFIRHFGVLLCGL